MKVLVSIRRILVTAAFLASASPAVAQQPVRLAIADGRVNLHVQNVPVRTILAEWARLGGATILNGESVTGTPLTLDLENVPERQALGIILRGVSGYLLAAREPGRAGASMFDRIVILPTSAAPRTPPPVGPVVGAGPIPNVPAGLPRPAVVRPDGQDLDADDDGVQGPRPAVLQRPIAIPAGLPVPPVTLDTPDEPPAPTPPAVVATPTNPFGMPPGSSARPGVIVTPPPAPARGTPQN